MATDDASPVASPDPRRSGTAAAVRSAVGAVLDPEIRRPLADLDMVGDVAVVDGRATVALRLTIVGCPAADRIEAEARVAAAGVPGIEHVDVELGVMTPTERDALIARLRGAKRQRFGPGTLTRVIAVTSGKGGVGKSTITAGLAVALADRGLAVGLIDADVFGYSIPGILGIPDARPTRVGDMILPPIAHGVRVMSIGMFLPPSGEGGGRAVSWRGPLLHRTMQQFLTDVWFGDLDVLLLDLPPGTGDVAISLGQLLPNAEVLVVTTPQSAAADVAERSAELARQSGQTVIGVVENMAGLVQPDGTVLDLFGRGGGDEVARRLGVPLLARVPLSVTLRESGDAGEPAVLEHPDDAAARVIRDLADRLVAIGRGLAGRRLPVATD